MVLKTSGCEHTDRISGSTSIQWAEDLDYLIQRQVGKRHFMFGGGNLHHPRGDLSEVFGQL